MRNRYDGSKKYQYKEIRPVTPEKRAARLSSCITTANGFFAVPGDEVGPAVAWAEAGLSKRLISESSYLPAVSAIAVGWKNNQAGKRSSGHANPATATA